MLTYICQHILTLSKRNVFTVFCDLSTVNISASLPTTGRHVNGTTAAALHSSVSAPPQHQAAHGVEGWVPLHLKYPSQPLLQSSTSTSTSDAHEAKIPKSIPLSLLSISLHFSYSHCPNSPTIYSLTYNLSQRQRPDALRSSPDSRESGLILSR